MDYEKLFGFLAVLFAVGLLAVGAHDLYESPVIETVTEYQTVTVEVPAECEVCEVCPEIVEEVVSEEVLNEVVDEDVIVCSEDRLEEQAIDNDIGEYMNDLLADNDFIEDEIMPFFATEYNCTISDDNDVDQVELEDISVEWDANDEEGEYVAEVEVHAYCNDDRDNYISRDIIISGIFDEDDLEDFADDGLDSYTIVDA